MFDNIVANIVAVGALIIFTVFGLGLLSTLAEPSPRGFPYRREHRTHYPPTPRPEPHPEPRPGPRPQRHHKQKVGGCSGTRFGCCPNGKTARKDDRGSNCPPIDAIGSTSTQTIADKHPETPAYSHGSTSKGGTTLPRSNSHPTMTHSQTPPQSTIVLISETASSIKEGLVGGMREGLTAKQQSLAQENEEARVNTIISSIKKLIDKCCSNSNKELFDKFAILMEASAAQTIKDLVGQAPHAIQTGDFNPLQVGQKKIEALTYLAGAARRLSDIGPASI